MPGWDEHSHAGYPNGDPYEMPVDLAAVQADDALLDMIGAGHASSDADDELTRVLAAWRQEVYAEPVRELVDTSTALAAIRAAARQPARRRNPVFGSIAGAAAVLVIAFSSVGLIAKSAQPGDHMWGVTQMLYKDYARSVETAAAVRTELNEATTALNQGYPERARATLQHIQQQLPAVGEAEGRTDLTARHRQLEQKLNAPPETGSVRLPDGSVFIPPSHAGAGPEASKPRDPSVPSPEGPATTPDSADELPGNTSGTDSNQFLRNRHYPKPHYPHPGDAPGRNGAPGRDVQNREAPDRDSPGDDSSEREDGPGEDTVNNRDGTSGANRPGASGGEGRPSPASKPADSRAPNTGHVEGPRSPSNGFPGCDRPPPRPSYCG